MCKNFVLRDLIRYVYFGFVNINLATIFYHFKLKRKKTKRKEISPQLLNYTNFVLWLSCQSSWRRNGFLKASKKSKCSADTLKENHWQQYWFWHQSFLLFTLQQLVLSDSLDGTAAGSVIVKMMEYVTHYMDTVLALQDGWEHSVSSVSVCS